MHKTKQDSSLWRQLSPYLKGFHLFFLVAILFSIVSSIITVIGPDKLKEITDTITKGMGGAIDIDKITSIALTLAILYGVGALVSYSSSFIISTMIQRFAERLRNAIAEKINRVPLQYFDSHEQGDTLSRVTNDVDLMTQSFNQSLVQMVSSIVLLIGSIFMMFKTSRISHTPDEHCPAFHPRGGVHDPDGYNPQIRSHGMLLKCQGFRYPHHSHDEKPPKNLHSENVLHCGCAQMQCGHNACGQYLPHCFPGRHSKTLSTVSDSCTGCQPSLRNGQYFPRRSEDVEVRKYPMADHPCGLPF